MLTFWIVAALFILLILWFVLPALLQKPDDKKDHDVRGANVLIYQDQSRELEADLKAGLMSEEQYQQDKDELERRLLDDIKPPNSEISGSPSAPSTQKFAYGVAAFIPIGAVALYFVVGNPKALNPSTATAGMPPTATQQGGPMSQQQIAANVEKLAKRLEQNPNDAQGWLMLARSYTSMERYAEAASAFEHATTLNGNDANTWADYAEALAMANGRRLAGKPTEALKRALQIDPKNQKALALAGSAAFETGDYKKAVDYWQKLLPQLPPGSEIEKTLADEIKKAQDLAAGKGSR